MLIWAILIAASLLNFSMSIVGPKVRVASIQPYKRLHVVNQLRKTKPCSLSSCPSMLFQSSNTLHLFADSSCNRVQRVLHSICTSHILLNLRKANVKISGLVLDEAPGVNIHAYSPAWHRQKSASNIVINVEHDFEFAGGAANKADEWTSETYNDTFAMVDTK